MIAFEFATAARIIFGEGKLREAAPAAKTMGKRALLVTGKNAARATPLLDSLAREGISSTIFSVSTEPSVALAQKGVELLRAHDCDLVISLGGGSAIDCGKAIAALASNPGNPLDYLEVIGRGKPLVNPPLAFIAIPTTTGTGAEVTRNAVLASPEHRVKVSLRSPLMLPRVALIDPELTYDLPADLTAATGLDALTQLIEPYLCNRANPMTDAICFEGIGRAARSLQKAVEAPNAQARHDMALASLFGGMALANAGLGAVHGFAAAIGGMYPIAHGAICAALLPHVFETNLRAATRPELHERFAHIARLLTGRSTAEAKDGLRWIRDLCQKLKIKPLGQFGIQPSAIPDLCDKAARSSSMKANPIALSQTELQSTLAAALLLEMV